MQVRALSNKRTAAASPSAPRCGWQPLLIALALSLLVGCSNPTRTAPTDSGERSTARSPAPTSVAPTPPPLRPDTQLAQDLWPPAERLPAKPSLPNDLPPSDISSTKWLHEHPVQSSTVALGMSAFGDTEAIQPGSVWVSHTRGEWRRVSMRRAGVTRPVFAEQQFALSPDGTVLALGDRRAVVLLNLSDASSRRFPTAAAEPVALTWAPDGESLIYADRHRPQDGYRLTLGSRSTSRTAYSALTTWPGPDDRALEFVMTEGKASTVDRWRDPNDVGRVNLSQEIRPDGPPVWGERAAFAQRYAKLGGSRVTTGVVTFDPRTGKFDAILKLSARQLRFASVLGWTDVDTVIVLVSGRSTSRLVAWTPETETLVQLTALNARGVILSIALNRLDE